MANIMKLGGGGDGDLNIAYGLTPPPDTTKLWVPLENAPDFVEVTSDSTQDDVDVLIKKKLTLPVPLANPAVLNGFVIGGYNGAYQDAIYGVSTTGIVQVATLPVAMCGAAAAQVPIDDYTDYRAIGMYIFGGYNGAYLNTIYELVRDASTGEYYCRNTYATLPVGLAYASAVAYNDRIYIIGGKASSGAQSTVYVYDPVENTCTHYCNLAEATYGAAVAQPYTWNGSSRQYRDSVCVIGGYSYKTSIQHIKLGLSSPVDGEVLTVKLPVGLQYASAIAYTTQVPGDEGGYVPDIGIYVCGGQASKSRSESPILKLCYDLYDPGNSTIVEMKSALPSMPYGMGAMANEGDDGGFFAAGGRDGNSYLDTVWQYIAQRTLARDCLRIYTNTFDPDGDYDPASMYLLNSSFARAKTHVSGVYLGEYRYTGYTSGMAREQLAYAYNTKTGKWQTLDGSATYEEVAE